ncbi:MAG: FAD-binding oxidoreductase [Rhodobacteraceae bacterium]|nr:FAD-binding oxidoreductase [Paracoccaceae bacterium]
MLNPADQAFATALAETLPDGVVGPVAPSYLEDPRGLFRGIGQVLARPGTTAEVSRIVRFCAERSVAIVPYGGGTGLVGGQVKPDAPEPLVLSLERMAAIREVDTGGNVMVAEAGAILAEVQAAADKADRLFPLSLASEGSCRIGGNLATNAGGVQVLRYGNARDLCLGIEAVLPDGSVYHGLRRLRKDNTGYDLRNLLVGSEGTLGVITAACLKLFPKPAETATAFVTLASPADALALLTRLGDTLDGLVSAFELIHAQGLRFVGETRPDVRLPFADIPGWSVLVEIGGGTGSNVTERLTLALEKAMLSGQVQDVLLAQNESQRQEFWTVRESTPEANKRIGAISSHDISVPIHVLPEFIAAGQDLVAGFGPLRLNCFGHLGDGNLHFNVFPPNGASRADYLHLREPVKDAVHDLVHQVDGSISAEHGIGRLKAGDLVKYSDPAKLAAMRSVKQALDPKGIMNPGAVLAVSAQ